MRIIEEYENYVLVEHNLSEWRDENGRPIIATIEPFKLEILDEEMKA